MRRPTRRTLTALGVLSTASALALPTAAAGASAPRGPAAAPGRHVLLLSVDGMHQSDLASYAASHPTSALAALLRGGTDYTRASTPVPSDSFPGMVGQVTGGNPRTTGSTTTSPTTGPCCPRARRAARARPPARGSPTTRASTSTRPDSMPDRV